MKNFFHLFIILFAVSMLSAAEFYTSFAEGKWNKDLFQIVKAPRNNGTGAMIQHRGHIANQVPEGLTEKELITSNETYCSMLLKEKFSGNMTVSAKMSFDHRMAPLIVIAPELGVSADRKHPELREHLEIILYDQGINIWHHKYINGRQSWYRLAYLTSSFSPKKIYDLCVSIRHTPKGWQLIIRCDGREFGCAVPAGFKTDGFFTGITGCEGINRFYDLKVTAIPVKL